MWPDNETTTDFLGFQVHADLLRSLIINPQLLPMTVGLFGDWGGGKTSIMKMLERDLNPDSYEPGVEKDKYEKIACVYFNGWLFEGYDDAKAAILTSVLLQLAENKRFGPKVQDKVISLLKSVNWMRVARYGLTQIAVPAATAYLTGGLSLVPAMINAGKTAVSGIVNSTDQDSAQPEGAADFSQFIKTDQNASGVIDVRNFRNNFEKMLKDSDIETLVVLIDDLDRCSPDRIVDNLEAIKLFLNVKNTAFVIGADQRIVRHAIATRYNTALTLNTNSPAEENQQLINDYLEKLIQIPYRIPRLSPTEVETYMSLLFCSKEIAEAENFMPIIEACDRMREENRFSVFGFEAVKSSLGEKEVPAGLSNSLKFGALSAPLITEGLKGNPRQIKRFLNALFLRKQLAQVAHLDHIQDDVLVKIMILEYTHPAEFTNLYDWQAQQDGFPEQIRKMEEILCPAEGEPNEDILTQIDPQWSSASMKKWIRMPPQLAAVDLRDYYWVARDRLESTQSGLSMIPPAIRMIYNDLISDQAPEHAKGLEMVKGLNPDDQETIVSLVRQYIGLNLTKNNGFDVLRSLIYANIPNSLETYCRILQDCDPTLVPAKEGLEIMILIKSKQECVTIINPLVDHLKTTNSMIGKALTKQTERKVK